MSYSYGVLPNPRNDYFHRIYMGNGPNSAARRHIIIAYDSEGTCRVLDQGSFEFQYYALYGDLERYYGG